MISLHGSMFEKQNECGVVDDSNLAAPPDAEFQPMESLFTAEMFQYERRLDEETEVEESVANPRKIVFGTPN